MDDEFYNTRDEFCHELFQIERISDNDKKALFNALVMNGFFTSPASTKYHLSCSGGLCKHSLNVYKTMRRMADTMFPGLITDESIRIVALLHDVDNMFNYEETYQNKKVYSENGSKQDNIGKFDWVSVPTYVRRQAKDRFVLGSHGQNSAYFVSQYIPLNVDEYSAILNHSGGSEEGTQDAFGCFPIAVLLHCADVIATFVEEGDNSIALAMAEEKPKEELTVQTGTPNVATN